VTSSVPLPSVTTQRKRLGNFVRRARIDKGLTQTALGDLIGCKQSKINKIEAGNCGTRTEDLERIVDELGIDPHTAEQMTALNARSTPPRVRSDGRAATPAWFSPIIERERDATEMFSWTGERIPGLLQSEHYMLAQFQATGRPDVTALVAERMGRQRIFENNPQSRYEFLLSESALERAVRSLKPATALDQLDHMLSLMKNHPSVRIHVVPYRAAAYVDPDYTILRFAEDSLNFAYSEYVSDLVEVKGDDLRKYDESQDALRFLALSTDETTQLLATLAQQVQDDMPP
jgi:transcriptional regulator with XRE-family HTH domain